jgi:hypothetical protein
MVALIRAKWSSLLATSFVFAVLVGLAQRILIDTVDGTLVMLSTMLFVALALYLMSTTRPVSGAPEPSVQDYIPYRCLS